MSEFRDLVQNHIQTTERFLIRLRSGAIRVIEAGDIAPEKNVTQMAIKIQEDNLELLIRALELAER